MPIYNYTVTLTSDGEPGSGFGTETLNSLIPRDEKGCPYIPASHIKGLMRENFTNAVQTFLDLNSVKTLAGVLFGRPGEEGDSGISGAFRISNATASGNNVATGQIARTKLNQSGTVADASLRISESIPAGTVFAGKLAVDGEHDSWQAITCRLALLSIDSIGANRTRGAGACYFETNAGQETPGKLLLKFKDIATPEAIAALAPPKRAIDADGLELSPKTVFVRISFTANAPICCPETPAIGNNVLKSGFAIPSSAVQGALLTKLDAADHKLASALFQAPNFRVWPLLPVFENGQTAFRVSQTHKISKLPVNGRHEFVDLFLHQKPWPEQASSSPLKGADGVLLQDASGVVKLWRSADMPRAINAHCVVNGQTGQERNLFTVESLAVKTFSGIAAIPEDAAEKLQAVFEDDHSVVLGRARTVQGGGCLTIKRLETGKLFPPTNAKEWESRVFILQSPAAIPEALRSTGQCAEDILKAMAMASGWGEVEDASASLGVLFGWNRHAGGGRQEAVPVVLAGSVFKLKSAVPDIEPLLVNGIGCLKDRGYGAVLPHPGEASERIDVKPEQKRFTRGRDTSRKGYELWQKTRGTLSVSQISGLTVEIVAGESHAKEYIQTQIKQRPKHISDKWKLVEPCIEEVIARRDALDILRVWRDLAVADDAKEIE